MKRLILAFLILSVLALSVAPVHANNSSSNKSWSKIKDIFK
jgi:hypothetical protein